MQACVSSDFQTPRHTRSVDIHAKLTVKLQIISTECNSYWQNVTYTGRIWHIGRIWFILAYCHSYWQNMQPVKCVLPFCFALPIQYTQLKWWRASAARRLICDEVMQVWRLGGCENFVGKWEEFVLNALVYFLTSGVTIGWEWCKWYFIMSSLNTCRKMSVML